MYLETAKLAFHAELVAADAAISFALEVGRIISNKNVNVKRTRFY